MGKSILGKAIRLSDEDAEAINKNLQEKVFGKRGVFSGTDICNCGGGVDYSLKRNGSAELGVCEKCGQVHIDYRGKRLHSVYDSSMRIN